MKRYQLNLQRLSLNQYITQVLIRASYGISTALFILGLFTVLYQFALSRLLPFFYSYLSSILLTGILYSILKPKILKKFCNKLPEIQTSNLKDSLATKLTFLTITIIARTLTVIVVAPLVYLVVAMMVFYRPH